MKDLRNKNNLILKKISKTASNGSLIESTVENIKTMLTFLGVNPEEDLVKEAYGYFSSHAMIINMNNLYDFLKSKSILAATDFQLKKK